MRAALLVVIVVVASGCGRKATEADCQLILDRMVELQMKEMKNTDPEAIEKKKVQLRTELAADMKDCAGRRVTDGLITCVRAAQTSEELSKCWQ